MRVRPDRPTFVPVGDHALLIAYATDISDAANDAVLALDAALAAAEIEGLCEVVPAYVNLLVVFDPLVTDHRRLQLAIEAIPPDADVSTQRRKQHQIAVCYDTTLAPDLESVAVACNMTTEAVINTHLASRYRVCMYGFAPGYAYMSGVPEALQLPRKPQVVRGVARGSLIIAGPQCLVTTLEMPTGWSIIGRSPARVLRNAPGVPVLFALGDIVQFERVDLATFEQLERDR